MRPEDKLLIKQVDNLTQQQQKACGVEYSYGDYFGKNSILGNGFMFISVNFIHESVEVCKEHNNGYPIIETLSYEL